MEIGPVIKNPVLDINKLVRQGTMLNQGVQNVDGDSTADQATVDLFANRDPVVHEVSVGISGEEASLYTVTGTPPLSLPNSLGKPLKAWSVDLLPYQEGTGDPSPTNVRPIHGTDKLNLFAESTYDQSATPKAVITLPQTVYTGTVGSEGGVSAWGEVDLGTLTWAKTTISGHYHFRALVSDGKYGAWGGFDALCDCYLRTTDPPTTVDNTFTFGSTYHHGSFCYVSIYDADFEDSTADDFKTAMSGHMLVYTLQTPTAFAVPSVTIPTPRGTANAWATAEDGAVDSMSVTYVGKA